MDKIIEKITRISMVVATITAIIWFIAQIYNSSSTIGQFIIGIIMLLTVIALFISTEDEEE